MKKTTINTILISIIAIMSISICFLIFCIMTRPRYVIVNEPETAAMIVESTELSENIQARNISSNETSAFSEENTLPQNKQGKTSTRVNIRNAASEDAKVLATVDEGTTFDIIEILDSGWTKILYQDSEAYISSKFVIVLNE